MRFRKRVYEIVEKAGRGDVQSRVFDISLLILISLNVIAVIAETTEAFASKYHLFFNRFEIFSVGIFTIEYIARIFSCTENPKYKQKFTGRIRYILTPLLLIDLLAVLPFYLPFLISVDLRLLRALRLFRITRVLKTGRYSRALNLLGQVTKAKKDELLAAYFVLAVLLILASSVMFYFENTAQPESFSSIPKTMWLVIATVTSVGYGDMVPITLGGRIGGSILMLMGLLIIALPVGIFSVGFIEHLQSAKSTMLCPHCEREIKRYKKL